jgi:flagellar basal-body rod protein FlgF
MDNALMIGLQSQRMLQQRLDATANNLANAATTGFKADGMVFEMLVKQPASAAAAPRDVRFVRDAGLMRDMSQGPVTRTGSPLDVAIEGDGFFIVKGPDGQSAYTRDGAFTLSADGTLVTKDGRPVLSATGSPVVFDAQGGVPSIDADGTVRVEGVEAGQIGLKKFADPSALEKIGDNLYAAAGQQPLDSDSRIVQFALEGSNVRPVVELTRLIEISRAYESAARIVKNGDDMRKEAIDHMGRAA